MCLSSRSVVVLVAALLSSIGLLSAQTVVNQNTHLTEPDTIMHTAACLPKGIRIGMAQTDLLSLMPELKHMGEFTSYPKLLFGQACDQADQKIIFGFNDHGALLSGIVLMTSSDVLSSRLKPVAAKQRVTTSSLSKKQGFEGRAEHLESIGFDFVEAVMNDKPYKRFRDRVGDRSYLVHEWALDDAYFYYNEQIESLSGERDRAAAGEQLSAKTALILKLVSSAMRHQSN